MGTVLNPYLSFQGKAREAMEFYEGVFGGKLNMQTFKEFGASSGPSQDDMIMHADLEVPGGIRIMAADTPEQMEYTPGTNVSMSLSGENEDELRGYFDKLSMGGSVEMPLEKAQWGDMFGMCTDRFGVRWMVNISPPQG